MIVPTADDLKTHGLLTDELLRLICDKQIADTELSLAMCRLPEWYLQRLEALVAQNGTGKPICWTDITADAIALAA